jgi:predicted DNA binding protein
MNWTIMPTPSRISKILSLIHNANDNSCRWSLYFTEMSQISKKHLLATTILRQLRQFYDNYDNSTTIYDNYDNFTTITTIIRQLRQFTTIYDIYDIYDNLRQLRQFTTFTTMNENKERLEPSSRRPCLTDRETMGILFSKSQKK